MRSKNDFEDSESLLPVRDTSRTESENAKEKLLLFSFSGFWNRMTSALWAFTISGR